MNIFGKLIWLCGGVDNITKVYEYF